MTKHRPETICVIGDATSVKVDAIKNYRLIRKMRSTSGIAAPRLGCTGMSQTHRAPPLRAALRARLRRISLTRYDQSDKLRAKAASG